MEAFPRSRTGAVNPGVPLMILSFLVVAAFLYWLRITAEPTESPADQADDEPGVVNEVPLAEFFADDGAYLGQEITLVQVPVTSLLGPHSFWTALGDAFGNPYLVHLSDAARADSVDLTVGVPLTVTGAVRQMSDSVLADWEAAGAFPQGESERFQAEFAERFLEAASLMEAEAEGPAEGGAGPSS